MTHYTVFVRKMTTGECMAVIVWGVALTVVVGFLLREAWEAWKTWRVERDMSEWARLLERHGKPLSARDKRSFIDEGIGHD